MMNVLEVDLNLLKVLSVLFEERSVSNAALRLKVSQPAVSAALRRLRQQFGDELFIRSGGGLVPSKFADSLEEPLSRAMQLIDSEILYARQFDPASASIDFRITTSDLGEAVLFPQLSRHLETNAPNCSITCVSLPPELLKKAMMQGEVDLAIGYFPDLVSNGIHEQRLSSMNLECLVRADHPLAGKKIDLQTFQEHEQVVIGHESRRLDAYESLISEMKLRRNIKVELANMTSLPPLIASSDLIAVAPEGIATQYGGLARVELPFDLPAIEVKVYWHHRSSADAAIMWLKSSLLKISLPLGGGQASAQAS